MTRKRVLLIEDTPADAELFRRSVEKSGQDIQLILATNLAEGLAAIQSADVVVSDLILPDSVDPIKTLHAVMGAASCPVIVLTATEDYRVPFECGRLDAAAFVMKGENVRQLIASVSYALGLQEWAKQRDKKLDEIMAKVENACSETGGEVAG